MTLDYVVVLPVMVGVGVAYAVRRYFSEGDIYTLKLMRRGLHLPEGFLADTSSQIIVNDIMDCSIDFVGQDEIITGAEHTRCVVEGDQVVGLVNPVSYRTGTEFRAGDVMLVDFIVIQSGTTLREILNEISKRDRSFAVVSMTGGLHRDEVIGVFSPIHLTRAIANSSKMYVQSQPKYKR